MGGLIFPTGVVLDNTRVLHARTAFEQPKSTGSPTSIGKQTEETETTRHLQGCYADRDALLSRFFALRAEAKRAEGNTAEAV